MATRDFFLLRENCAIFILIKMCFYDVNWTHRPYRWFVSWLLSCFEPDELTSAGCECELRSDEWCGWTEGNRLGENLHSKSFLLEIVLQWNFAFCLPREWRVDRKRWWIRTSEARGRVWRMPWGCNLCHLWTQHRVVWIIWGGKWIQSRTSW